MIPWKTELIMFRNNLRTKPKTDAIYNKKGNFSSSNCVSNTLSDRAKQSSITLNHGNTLECKACNFTEKKGADAVKKAHSDSGQHILLGSHDKLDMNNIVCKSKKYTVYHEAWPLRIHPKQPQEYVCSRCSRNKSIPKKFSEENSMIPSSLSL
ncbi:hypothetical protein P5673_025216 [Acropora cervicornis]|uniref:Uncharacterized protein n=1 Tax=Acropora cervicornis TaxID=6130 RepID=A0AAD9UXK2_ACRCE|nr:hypothetical protein P5673_025216 [Acropora cervicornis]